ncbi:SWI/SNF-related matrix-associated actin-dependent regulator of chromatin subfamily E member 1-related-like [Cimex lectularius]|uniref:HMG box domain-containing protein n=1 Tax=Cimex lectularius TaxID=79782 RepID=A0A8I6RB95_CIMLE|nr:SWI/SNF-related matrix-associated actin-dependent regulator of chromatin subfamily E member 1-related-like [Cimex lectularius]
MSAEIKVEPMEEEPTAGAPVAADAEQPTPAEQPPPATTATADAAVAPTPAETAGEPGESQEPTPQAEKPENGPPKKGWPKGKKRKKVKDETAPRQPLTGYVRFLTDRREHIRAENPTLPFAEITKLLAAEWAVLPQDQKQQYLSAAEQDRVRYLEEVAAYKASQAYRVVNNFNQNMKKPKVEIEESSQTALEKNQMAICDIPIFTEEFLDHNKSREVELRQLRKSNTDYEQQNATIQTYIAGLQAAINKLDAETRLQTVNNNALEEQLTYLKNLFVNIFKKVKVPGIESPSLETMNQDVANFILYYHANPTSSIVESVKKVYKEMRPPPEKLTGLPPVKHS